MHVGVVLYGAARVVIGQPLVEVSFDTSSVTLGQLLERMIATYPRARPYLHFQKNYVAKSDTFPPKSIACQSFGSLSKYMRYFSV
jgi:hypothetical protein